MIQGRPPRPPRPMYMHPPRPPINNEHGRGRPTMPGPFHGQLPSAKTKSHWMTMFQTPDGNIDLAKIANVAQQMNQIYGEISPLISKFLKK
ncbi:YppG family protein [Aliibacillus thermotolerans]|uniref:YppG family protein n=1 Tax=Aliibacillus thermotolerans TaxID=1834418 RepID=A0ABW0U7L3_9BACI|nr:YppG family protein [Aliibacillus thermotolerans]MDA3129786.1 hypothetical protein [Aliibacillus thermotolerans]